MAYISVTERGKFSHPISEVLGVLRDANDPMYVKGEYFGYFANRLVKKFLGDPNYVHQSFNSAFFNESKRKTLANSADSMAAVVHKSDPLNSASELYYALSAVYQGFLGMAEGFEEATYGLRVYLRGILEKVMQTMETVNTGSQKDMAMTFRRHLIIRGVLADVVDSFKDMSNTHTTALTPLNMPIWDKDGKLVLPTGLAVKE